MNYVALCGRPTSGKSFVKNILCEHKPFEDLQGGLVVRRLAAAATGIPLEGWLSQTQKLEPVCFNGIVYSKREFLGLIGKGFEEQFGEGAVPSSAMMFAGEPGERILVDDSTRRGQGFVFRNHGGLVVEIVRPGVEPTGFDFDEYAGEPVHLVVHNDSTMEDLDRFVRETLVGALLQPDFVRCLLAQNPGTRFNISVKGNLDAHHSRAA